MRSDDNPKADVYDAMTSSEPDTMQRWLSFYPRVSRRIGISRAAAKWRIFDCVFEERLHEMLGPLDDGVTLVETDPHVLEKIRKDGPTE
jgi:hypothetical protein